LKVIVAATVVSLKAWAVLADGLTLPRVFSMIHHGADEPWWTLMLDIESPGFLFQRFKVNLNDCGFFRI